MMTGDSIAAAVLMHIRRAAGRRKPVVTREFTLGESSVRADLAILGDEFIGVEIKGHRDTLRRLPAQMEAYSRYFDKTIAVVANRHLRHLDRTALCGAALWSFDIQGNLTEIRKGEHPYAVHSAAYLETMTQQEKRRHLSLAGDEEDLRSIFRTVFTRRYGATSNEFWLQVKGRRITEHDLPILSRFSQARSAHRQYVEDRERFWQRWSQEADESSD
jgi:hypothetical protein